MQSTTSARMRTDLRTPSTSLNISKPHGHGHTACTRTAHEDLSKPRALQYVNRSQAGISGVPDNFGEINIQIIRLALLDGLYVSINTLAEF